MCPRDHRTLPDLYHATDLGIFPNRVEGGNNMVLMEYMACGKPALVSFNSGHTDIVRRINAVLIEKLDWCWKNHDELENLGEKAVATMRSIAWQAASNALLARPSCRGASNCHVEMATPISSNEVCVRCSD